MLETIQLTNKTVTESSHHIRIWKYLSHILHISCMAGMHPCHQCLCMLLPRECTLLTCPSIRIQSSLMDRCYHMLCCHHSRYRSSIHQAMSQSHRSKCRLQALLGQWIPQMGKCTILPLHHGNSKETGQGTSVTTPTQSSIKNITRAGSMTTCVHLMYPNSFLCHSLA
ncbi:hypothetical protein BGX38DRAFT_1176312 [Terfezia claveryi]|nr:hypothetical protein BGX38DRAFT_1176312 [Terfezia claveryi]